MSDPVGCCAGRPGVCSRHLAGTGSSRRGLLVVPSRHSLSALGWNRTSDLRFRKPMLYPLSYEGGTAEPVTV